MYVDYKTDLLSKRLKDMFVKLYISMNMIQVKQPRPKLYIPNSGTVSGQNTSSALVREHELLSYKT